MPHHRSVDLISRLPRIAARGLIRAYQLTLSPWVGTQCRHLPTCSVYGDEAIARFGLWAGGWMTLARFCRCHPFGTRGLDFVPAALPANARWWLPWRYGRWRGTLAEPPSPAAPATGPAAAAPATACGCGAEAALRTERTSEASRRAGTVDPSAAAPHDRT